MSLTKRLVSAQTLAERYAVERKDVYKWARCGAVNPMRLGLRCLRFDQDECDRLVGHLPSHPTGGQNRGT
jgi:predicted site-specific integrase-resolvase